VSYFNDVLFFQECGPTIVGDEWSDPELMEFLGAKLINDFGNNLYVKFHNTFMNK
jgi:hypothetical protein